MTAEEVCRSVSSHLEVSALDVTSNCNRISGIGYSDCKLLTITDVLRRARKARSFHCHIWRLEVFDSVFGGVIHRGHISIGIASSTVRLLVCTSQHGQKSKGSCIR
jgi:hypothetical protein